ncbi:MAG: YebC/PmpR family DNA-binding transcriptional regulator [Clostridia bacterium]|nr:YebC/PmpR family DNA-binding transcriptional regulator [Clostridia bacterium]
MSGHSKWNNIKHKKEKTDAQRAKVFTKIGKEIAMAVKAGGADPNANSKLRDLISKAKSLNVPNDNIDRIIKKAASSDSENYESIYYEGYGPSGIAVIVECATDNRNRTSADLRHYFDKFGGNLGTTGCVSYLFTDQGIVLIDSEGVDEDALMEAALEAGADDIGLEGDTFEVLTPVNDVYAVKEALENVGYIVLSTEEAKIPSTYVNLSDEEAVIKMQKLIDALDDNEDVQNYWHNWENE